MNEWDSQILKSKALRHINKALVNAAVFDNHVGITPRNDYSFLFRVCLSFRLSSPVFQVDRLLDG